MLYDSKLQSICISERRFYQKLTDIYATAIGYNCDASTTRLFFKKVQNKMHYAVNGHTATELIVERDIPITMEYMAKRIDSSSNTQQENPTTGYTSPAPLMLHKRRKIP